MTTVLLPSMIGIYSNSKIWGGVEVLVTRLAEYLHRWAIPFCLIEPPGTRLYEDLRWAKPIAPRSIGMFANHISHLFLPSVAKLRDPYLPWAECGEARLFAWIVHPNDPFRSFFPFSGKLLDTIGYKGVALLRNFMLGHAVSVQAVFNLLLEGKSLAAMDGATRRALHYFYPSLIRDPVQIPIPSTPTPHAGRDGERTRSTGISIGYLGRLDAFKFSALAPFVSTELRRLAERIPVKLHVVAEGPYLDSLEKICKKARVSLRSHGFQLNDIARRTIHSQTDLAVAMGTAALDIASTGHPCVIIDPALGKLARPQASFRFVHEIEQFTLGEYRDFPGYINGLHDFSEIIELCRSKDIEHAGRDYVINHHNSDDCFKALIEAINSSEVAVSEVGAVVKDAEQSFNCIRHWNVCGRRSQDSILV